MASGPDPANLVFPTGVDVYSMKIDRDVIVSGEAHVIPVGAPYQYFLDWVPQEGIPSLVSIAGFTEVTGTPGPGDYFVTYSGVNSGLILHDSFNAGNAISVTYTTNGTTITAEMLNSLQVSVTGIETFILDGLGITGSFVPITGGTITGDVTLDGGSLLTSVSGGNTIGSSVTPFSSVNADTHVGNFLQSTSGTDKITLGASIIISGNTYVRIDSDEINLNSAGLVNITAPSGVEIDGHTLPTGTNLFDLGTSAKRWRILYADDIDLTSGGGFVRVTGDTMTGNLTMAGSTFIDVSSITSESSALSISASGSLSLSSTNDGITMSVPPGETILWPGILNATTSLITIQTALIPNLSGTHDIGTPGLPIDSVYANNFVGINLSGDFVKISGDTMQGNLNIGSFELQTDTITTTAPSGILDVNVGELNLNVGNNVSFDIGPSGTEKFAIGLSAISMSSDLHPTATGTYDIGTPAVPLRALYADNLFFASADGTFGDVTITGTLGMASGATFAPLVSGTANLGTSGSYWGTIYADQIITSESTGTFISKFGDTMIGELAFGTGSTITSDASGTTDIGSVSNPFGTIYASNVVSTGTDDQFVEKTGDTMSGPLTLSNIDSAGSLFISGTTDIRISGNQIYEDAEQINYTTDIGPIIVNANTEIQLLSNSTSILAINPTGTESFNNIYPNLSGNHTLGTPEKPWSAIYALNIVPVGVSGTGNFVLKAGDNMSGDLTFSSGIGVGLLVSGTSDIGTAALPLNAIYADNILGAGGAFVHITGDTMTGDLIVNKANWSIVSGGVSQQITISPSSGTEINAGNGRITLNGDSGGLYFDGDGGPVDIIANSSNGMTTSVGGGRYLLDVGGADTVFSGSSGDTRFNVDSGDFNINVDGGWVYATGSAGVRISTDPLSSSDIEILVNASNPASAVRVSGNILPWISGNFSLGVSDIPWGDAYIQTINGVAATHDIYNEVPTGDSDGVNDTFVTLTTPVSGTQRVFRAGLRMSPDSVDYDFSGSTITFISPPISGDNILVDYEYPAY